MPFLSRKKKLSIDVSPTRMATPAVSSDRSSSTLNYRTIVPQHHDDLQSPSSSAAASTVVPIASLAAPTLSAIHHRVPGLPYRKLDSNDDLESSKTNSFLSGNNEEDDDNDDDDDDIFAQPLVVDDAPSSDDTSMAFGDMSQSRFRLRRNIMSIRLRDILELLYAFGIFIMCEIATRRLEASHGDWRRPIPYQKLSNGDVVLDSELMYPVMPNTVSPHALTMIAIVMPIIIVLIVGFCFGPRNDVKAGLCVILVGHGTNFFISHTLKFYVGRFRPNFYAMCEFNKETLQCDASAGAVKSAQHSFPSGHSAESFCGLVIVSLFLLGKVGFHSGYLQQHHSHHHGHGHHGGGGDWTARRWRYHLRQRLLTLAAASPVVVAILIAASRVHDFMHHPADVIAGSLIGSLCGCFAYLLWYPTIWHEQYAGIPLQNIEESGGR